MYEVMDLNDVKLSNYDCQSLPAQQNENVPSFRYSAYVNKTTISRMMIKALMMQWIFGDIDGTDNIRLPPVNCFSNRALEVVSSENFKECFNAAQSQECRECSIDNPKQTVENLTDGVNFSPLNGIANKNEEKNYEYFGYSLVKERFCKCAKMNQNKANVEKYQHKVCYIYDKKTGRNRRYFICDFPGCGMKFTKTWNLLDHARTHTGERPFKCNLCELSFTQKGNLNKHKKIHSDEGITDRKVYKCEHCYKSYTERFNLNVHMKKHTNIVLNIRKKTKRPLPSQPHQDSKKIKN